MPSLILILNRDAALTIGAYDLGMTATRRELDLTLDALAAAMPKLMAETSEECHSDAFASMADDILEAAYPIDKSHVWSRLQCIQREHGLIPGDEGDAGDDGERPGGAG